tara:strand:- start:505 stop:942 length:438 start_codon:yes stop_codon:yes gene_type:complete
MISLNIDEIKELIPHRDPFLFVDSCNIVIEGEHGISFKKFSEKEYFFKGHFPDNPIVPGVIIVEAMAQTAGIVVSYKLRNYEEKSVLFMSVNKAKFRKPILPNYNVSFEVKFLNRVKDVYKFKGICLYNNLKVSEAEFSAMITYK